MCPLPVINDPARDTIECGPPVTMDSISSFKKSQIMNLQHFSARLDEQHLQRDQEAINHFMETVIVKKTATQFVPGAPDFWSILVFYEPTNGHAGNGSDNPPLTKLRNEPKHEPKSDPKNEPHPEPEPEEELTDEQTQLLLALKTWRKDKAHEIQRPEYLIAHNATLISLAKHKPRQMSELSAIKGLGPQKVVQYGEDLMAILNAF